MLKEASKGHFAAYLKRGRTIGGVPSWDIVNNPLDLGTDRRSKEFQKLRRLQQKLLGDLRGGVKSIEQLDLLAPSTDDQVTKSVRSERGKKPS